MTLELGIISCMGDLGGTHIIQIYQQHTSHCSTVMH